MSVVIERPTGNLPVGWRWERIDTLCEIQLGKMLSPASKIGSSPLPYLRNQNVQWSRFDLRDIARMDFSETEQEKFVLRKGDLLVCEGGEPGRAAVWSSEIEPCFYQKALHRLRPKGNLVDPHFLMHRLRLGALSGEFSGSNAKTTIAHLPLVRLASLRVATPSLKEQRRIAAMLNEQIAQVESLKERIRTGLEESGRACESARQKVIRESLRSCIRTTIGNVLVRIEAGKSVQSLERPPKQGEKAVLKVSAMSWDKFDPTEAKALPPDYAPPASHLVRKGDLLMSRANTQELVGAAVLVEEDHPDLVLSDKSLRLVIDPAKAIPEYLLAALRFPEARSFIEEKATGSSSSMRNISQELLRDIPMPIPDVAIQREVATKLSAISAIRMSLMGSFKKQLEAASLLPPAYLRRAFAGSV